MPKAIEHIVDAYIGLGNRTALENLMSHRRRLLADLKNRTGFDFSLPIGQIEDEIAVITVALERFDETHAPRLVSEPEPDRSVTD